MFRHKLKQIVSYSQKEKPDNTLIIRSVIAQFEGVSHFPASYDKEVGVSLLAKLGQTSLNSLQTGTHS